MTLNFFCIHSNITLAREALAKDAKTQRREERKKERNIKSSFSSRLCVFAPLASLASERYVFLHTHAIEAA
jgi:hypothetical protein